MPTEAEWEYAARSGGKNEQWAGTSNESELAAYAWFGSHSMMTTHPVGHKKPNGLGLYDMSGNVWEWCQDWYDSKYYKKSPKDNPKGPIDGQERVIRGGFWNHLPVNIRTSFRSRYRPFERFESVIGFRLVLPFEKKISTPTDQDLLKKKIKRNYGKPYMIDFAKLAQILPIESIKIHSDKFNAGLLPLTSIENYVGKVSIYSVNLTRAEKDEVILVRSLPAHLLILRHIDGHYKTIFESNGQIDHCSIFDIRDLNNDGYKEIIARFGMGMHSPDLTEIIWWNANNKKFESITKSVQDIWELDDDQVYEIEINEDLENLDNYDFSNEKAVVSTLEMNDIKTSWKSLIKWERGRFVDVSNKYPQFYQDYVIPEYKKEIEQYQSSAHKPWIKIAIANREKLVEKAIKIVDKGR